MIKRPDLDLERGGYSALVYKDGDLFVADDNVGTTLKEGTVASTIIQAALDNKVGRILCLDEQYELAAPVSIPSYRSLEGESRKTILEQPSTPLEELIKNDYSGGTTDIAIRNLTLDGKSRGADYKHGIWLQNVTRFEISSINGLNFTGSGSNKYNNLVMVGNHGATSRLASYGAISNILADTIQGDVVYVTGENSTVNYSKYVNINNIIAKNCTYITVDFNEVEYSNIDNVIGYNPGNFCVNLDGSHFCNINNITSYTPKVGLCFGSHETGATGLSRYNTASNIICYQPTQNGIFILNSTDNLISNFQIYGGSETGPAIYIQSYGAGTTDEGVASRNQFKNGIIVEPNKEGVYVSEATGPDIASYCKFTDVHVTKTTGTSATGFKIDGEYCKMVSCIAKGAKILKGFDITSGASGCDLSLCNVWDVDTIGFVLAAGNCILTGCRANTCDESGFWSAVARNVFSGCISKENGQDGAATYKDGFSFYGEINHYSEVIGCIAIGNAAYGVKGHAAPDYLLLTGNALTGNTSGSTNTLGTHSKADANNNFL